MQSATTKNKPVESVNNDLYKSSRPFTAYNPSNMHAAEDTLLNQKLLESVNKKDEAPSEWSNVYDQNH